MRGRASRVAAALALCGVLALGLTARSASAPLEEAQLDGQDGWSLDPATGVRWKALDEAALALLGREGKMGWATLVPSGLMSLFQSAEQVQLSAAAFGAVHTFSFEFKGEDPSTAFVFANARPGIPYDGSIPQGQFTVMHRTYVAAEEDAIMSGGTATFLPTVEGQAVPPPQFSTLGVYEVHELQLFILDRLHEVLYALGLDEVADWAMGEVEVLVAVANQCGQDLQDPAPMEPSIACPALRPTLDSQRPTFNTAFNTAPSSDETAPRHSVPRSIGFIGEMDWCDQHESDWAQLMHDLFHQSTGMKAAFDDTKWDFQLAWTSCAFAAGGPYDHNAGTYEHVHDPAEGWSRHPWPFNNVPSESHAADVTLHPEYDVQRERSYHNAIITYNGTEDPIYSPDRGMRAYVHHMLFHSPTLVNPDNLELFHYAAYIGAGGVAVPANTAHSPPPADRALITDQVSSLQMGMIHEVGHNFGADHCLATETSSGSDVWDVMAASGCQSPSPTVPYDEANGSTTTNWFSNEKAYFGPSATIPESNLQRIDDH